MKRQGYIKHIIISLLLIVPICAFSQSEGLADTLEQAEKLFEEGDFLKAVPYYEHLDDQYPDTSYFQYKLGVCLIHKTDEHPRALRYLKKVEQKNPEAPELNFYLGRVYHLNYDFGTAISYFIKSLGEYKEKDARYKEIKRYIKNCESGRDLYANPRFLNMTNIGSPVNTEGMEYGPAISASGNTLIYTYRGKTSKGGEQNGEFRDDILISTKLENGLWSAPVSISDNVNTDGNEASISVSTDEQKLFVYKFTPEDRGDIYLSEYDKSKEKWSTPAKLEGEVNTEFWEGSCSLSPDGKTLYFVSSRIGGYGGRDIWVAKLQEDGSWGEVENLGPEVNTEHDEDGPFIYPNGQVLFFGSNGHNSMGGYDIFQSELSEDGHWFQPVNLGYPINTVVNDIYYTISASGRGYYSSDKKGGYGKHDIYVVDPGFVGKKIVLALVKGTVTYNGEPEGADIFVTDSKGNELNEMYRSNIENGRYILTLLPGKEYDITYMAENGTEEVRKVSTMDVDSFTIMDIDVDFNTFVYEKLNMAYDMAIKKGNEAFENEDYLNAIVYFSQAIGYDPEKEYPKDQIKIAREKLNEKLRSGEEIVVNDFQDDYVGGGGNAKNLNNGNNNIGNGDKTIKGNEGDIVIKKDAIDAAEDASTRYTLQIAAATNKAMAESLYAKFKNIGYDAYIQRVTFTDVNEKWYRVRISSFKSLDLAINDAKKLLKEPLPQGKVWVDVKREDNLKTQKATYDKTPLIER